MKLRYLLLLSVITLSIAAKAKITITKQTCNNQTGFAIVENGEARIGWQMTSNINGDYQTARQIEVVENGTGRRVWLSKKETTGESQMLKLPTLKYNDHGYKWRVRVWDCKKKASDWSKWQTFIIAPQDIDAQWIGAISKKEAKIPDSRWSNTSFKKQDFLEAWKDVNSLSSKSIWLRKSLQLKDKEILDAHILVSGLGHYKLYINNIEASDAEFAPLWTDYSKTVYYNAYDVTSLLRNGEAGTKPEQPDPRASKSNLKRPVLGGFVAEIQALLGNGMYNVQRNGRYAKFQASYGAPKLLLRLIINYKDGSHQILSTDDTWQWALSPITFNSIYGGESYDARLEKTAESDWHQAKIVENPAAKLRPQTAPPVKIMERYPIKSFQILPDNSFVCDMGLNLAGFPEIKLSNNPKGKTVRLLVSEKLNPDGSCNQKQTGRPHFYEYNGNGTWHPHFSYYGFRYIQIQGAMMKGEPNPDDLPVIESLNSCFIHNSAEEYSSFESSNPLFTQTHRLIERAERSNMQSVLTDCPHREKLGWLEQDHLNGPSLLYNYDLTTFGPKFIRDICDAQQPDGFVPTTAPQYVEFGNQWGDFDDSPEWASTLIIFPFQYYEQYGDSTLIINNYDAMKRYAEYLHSRLTDSVRVDGKTVSFAPYKVLDFGLGDWYDYQPDAPAGFSKNTPIALVATAHYIYDLQLLKRAAEMQGKEEDRRQFEAELQTTVTAFNRVFFHKNSLYYGNNSQCSNALPLFLGICGEHKDAVLKKLIDDIKAHGNRLTTGDVGNRYLIQSLSRNGHDALVYAMFNHNDTPGYGFQIQQGATTLTEQWDPLHGTSLNHFMMGQIDEWLFRSLAGIQNAPGTYGLRDIIIRPQFPGDLKSVKAKTANLYGTISVEATPTSATVEIPVGSQATVILPNGISRHVGSGKHLVK